VLMPQVLLNVPVREKRPIEKVPALQQRIDAIEKELGESGRILVRYSGTEPLLRIMIEGPNQDRIQGYAEELADRVRGEVGG